MSVRSQLSWISFSSWGLRFLMIFVHVQWALENRTLFLLFGYRFLTLLLESTFSQSFVGSISRCVSWKAEASLSLFGTSNFQSSGWLLSSRPWVSQLRASSATSFYVGIPDHGESLLNSAEVRGIQECRPLASWTLGPSPRLGFLPGLAGTPATFSRAPDSLTRSSVYY